MGKCVGIGGKVRRSEVVWEMWGRCGKVCWGVDGSENRCGEGEEKWGEWERVWGEVKGGVGE